MTLEQAQKKVDEWIHTYGVRYFSELTNTTLLMEEMGELARLIARTYGDQSFKKEEDKKNIPEKIADEMADILFVLICLANQTKVNLTLALEKNLQKKTQRDADRHLNNPKLH